MGADRENKRVDGRMAAIVIAVTGLFWIGATWAGGHFGWTNRTRALMDLIALAGFVFAMITLARVLRARKKDGSKG